MVDDRRHGDGATNDGHRFGRDKTGFRRFFAYLEETGLDEPIRRICRGHATTLYEIYSNDRGPTAHAGRLETWWVLTNVYRKSTGEIARFFERDATSIGYALKQLAGEENLSVDTVGVIARRVATKRHATWVETGRKNGWKNAR